MTTCENSSASILNLALRIARRADEIGQQTSGAFDDLTAWLRAEEEILGIRLPAPPLRAATHALRREAAATACSSS